MITLYIPMWILTVLARLTFQQCEKKFQMKEMSACCFQFFFSGTTFIKNLI